METKALFLKAVLICITCKERLPKLICTSRSNKKL